MIEDYQDITVRPDPMKNERLFKMRIVYTKLKGNNDIDVEASEDDEPHSFFHKV